MSDAIDIRWEAVAAWKDRYGVNPALWGNITALRAALDAQATPLAEVAMLERAAGICDQHAKKEAARGRGDFIAHQIDRDAIRALPTTATPAELLAAADRLPEVALIMDWAAEIFEASDPDNEDSHFCDNPREFAEGIAFDARRKEIHAALAPFTREGE